MSDANKEQTMVRRSHYESGRRVRPVQADRAGRGSSVDSSKLPFKPSRELVAELVSLVAEREFQLSIGNYSDAAIIDEKINGIVFGKRDPAPVAYQSLTLTLPNLADFGDEPVEDFAPAGGHAQAQEPQRTGITDTGVEQMDDTAQDVGAAMEAEARGVENFPPARLSAENAPRRKSSLPTLSASQASLRLSASKRLKRFALRCLRRRSGHG